MAEVDLSAVFTLVASIAADMREVKAEMREMKAKMATKEDLAALRTELKSEIADLRDAVHQYHSAVIGHGVLIDEHDSRLIRVERQLGLPHRIG